MSTDLPAHHLLRSFSLLHCGCGMLLTVAVEPHDVVVVVVEPAVVVVTVPVVTVPEVEVKLVDAVPVTDVEPEDTLPECDPVDAVELLVPLPQWLEKLDVPCPPCDPVLLGPGPPPFEPPLVVVPHPPPPWLADVVDAVFSSFDVVGT